MDSEFLEGLIRFEVEEMAFETFGQDYPDLTGDAQYRLRMASIDRLGLDRWNVVRSTSRLGSDKAA